MKITSNKNLNEAIKRVIDAAKNTECLNEYSGLNLLEKLKFEKCGTNPFKGKEEYNLIEQVNQTFTALVSYKAVEWLWRKYNKEFPLTLNEGPVSGADIKSENAPKILAEVFASVDWKNNNKLKKDIAKLFAVDNAGDYDKYVFFTQPIDPKLKTYIAEQCDDTVNIVYFPLEEIMTFIPEER